MLFTFQITIHPNMTDGRYNGLHTLLFTHSAFPDARTPKEEGGMCYQDITSCQLCDETMHLLVEGDELAASGKATEIACGLCDDISIPYTPTVEDVASVATEIRHRAQDASEVYHGAVAGYSF